MARLREAAGAAGPDEARLLAMMHQDDFDPASYDTAMASAFGGDYYNVSTLAGNWDRSEIIFQSDHLPERLRCLLVPTDENSSRRIHRGHDMRYC